MCRNPSPCFPVSRQPCRITTSHMIMLLPGRRGKWQTAILRKVGNKRRLLDAPPIISTSSRRPNARKGFRFLSHPPASCWTTSVPLNMKLREEGDRAGVSRQRWGSGWPEVTLTPAVEAQLPQGLLRRRSKPQGTPQAALG